jgi:formylglycine-generating enzyme required for sulfatase activity
LDKEKKMKNAKLSTIVVCIVLAAGFASADIIRGISMDFVNIGFAGNAGDTRTGTEPSGRNKVNPPGCGAVAYNYRIGKYELTNAQWNTFVSLSGAPTGSDGGYTTGSYWTGNSMPVGAVTWYEAMQFCNYLTTGDKSKGAYLFSGTNANAGAFLGIDRATALSTYGKAYVLPNEDEWYKAAYFKADGTGFTQYANGTDVAPIFKGTDTNWGWGYAGAGVPWAVGSGAMEQNGTYDMMGNFWEWTETLLLPSYPHPTIRGAAYFNPDAYLLSTAYRNASYANTENTTFTFRVAEIPEPATMITLALGGLALLRKK